MARTTHRNLAVSLAVILPLFLAGCGGGGEGGAADPCKTTTLKGQGETIKAARERSKRALDMFKKRMKTKGKDKTSKIVDTKTTCVAPEKPKPLAEGEEPPPPPKGPKPRPTCEVAVKVCPK